MKKKILPLDFILKFKEHLILDERSVATVENISAMLKPLPIM